MSKAPVVTETTDRGLTQLEIDQRVFDLYDEYCHGHIDRREFLVRASSLAIAGGLVMAQALLPRYARHKRFYQPIRVSRRRMSTTPRLVVIRDVCVLIRCNRSVAGHFRSFWSYMKIVA